MAISSIHRQFMSADHSNQGASPRSSDDEQMAQHVSGTPGNLPHAEVPTGDCTARWIACSLALGVSSVATAAPEPIRVEYRAPATCPGEAEVVGRLVAKAAVTRVDAREARVFALSVERDHDGFRGRLDVRGSDGIAAGREVNGATCDEAIAALVLVAALAAEDRAPAPAASRATAGWRFAFGAGFARYEGMTPEAIYGVPIHLAARRDKTELRATFDATGSDQLAMTSFRWTAGRAEVCRYVAAIGPLEAAPCAGFEAGALSGRGTNVGQASDDTRPWFAPELTGRVALRIGRAAVELEGTAEAPVVRDRYYIAPATTVHQVPALAFGLGASLGVQFR
jgi:hypothetical protein